MFRHGIKHNEAIIEGIEDERETDNCNKTFENPANINIETVELRVDVPCRDTFLKNDQILYWNELKSLVKLRRLITSMCINKGVIKWELI